MKDSSEEKEILKIGEIAEKSGLPISTIRHYTSKGLLRVVAYTDGGQYLYDKEGTLEELNYISEMQNRGMSLEEICQKNSNNGKFKKIVIIDDDEDFAKYLKDAVMNAYPKWETRTCINVFDAGHLLVYSLPDLVFLDIQLPGVDGYEICKFIKTNIALKHTKVIAMTSNNTEQSRKKMLDNGADDYLPKPIDVEILLKAIKKYL